MGKLQDFFELRSARKMLSALSNQLLHWQRDFTQTAKAVQEMPHPTGTEVPPAPNALQHLPEDVRELRHYIETRAPQLAHDEEILREQVMPLYKGVSLLESLLSNARDVQNALVGLQRLLENLNAYYPYHELLLEVADDLPVSVRRAMRVVTQLGRVKWNPILEQLRALQHLQETEPLLRKRFKRSTLLRDLDPAWRGVMRLNAMNPVSVEDDWDDEDDDGDYDDEDYDDEDYDDEVYEEGAHLRDLAGRDDIEEESEEEDDEEMSDEEVAEMRRRHPPKKRSLDDVVDEDDPVELPDDDGWEDDDDDGDPLPPVKNRFTRRIKKKKR
jgi:hypothetical protein